VPRCRRLRYLVPPLPPLGLERLSPLPSFLPFSLSPARHDSASRLLPAASADDSRKQANSCSSSSCDHYTQVVWEATTSVGCAVAHCGAGSPFAVDVHGSGWTAVVCRYHPAAARELPGGSASCTGTTDGAGGACALNSNGTACALTRFNCNTSAPADCSGGAPGCRACGGDCRYTSSISAARPFGPSRCNTSAVGTCLANGTAPDSAAAEAALSADPGAGVGVACVPTPDAAHRIDLLVLYTPEALGALGGSLATLEQRVRIGVADANTALENSRLNLTLNLSSVEVSPFLACIGSPCLRHCVHGAPIGGALRRGQRRRDGRGTAGAPHSLAAGACVRARLRRVAQNRPTAIPPTLSRHPSLIYIIMIRTKDEMNRHAGESQSLRMFLS
jgi:hypothetical protein